MQGTVQGSPGISIGATLSTEGWTHVDGDADTPAGWRRLKIQGQDEPSPGVSPLPPADAPMPLDASLRPVAGAAWAKPGHVGRWAPPDRSLTRGLAVAPAPGPAALEPVPDVAPVDDLPAPHGLLNERAAAERGRMPVGVLRRHAGRAPEFVGAVVLDGRTLYRPDAEAFRDASTIVGVIDRSS